MGERSLWKEDVSQITRRGTGQDFQKWKKFLQIFKITDLDGRNSLRRFDLFQNLEAS